ncbi:MAG TPA: hypothetical protein G4N96_09945 [Chloroflexi bacterium]|nr:hypothetical protein [Chloroflexota bacterium]
MSNLMQELHKSFLLVWQLFKNPRVPWWAKIIPVAAVLYWFNPIDPIPIPLLDDVIALLIGYKLFVDSAPNDLVDRLKRSIQYGKPIDDSDEVIDASYQVLDDE